MRNIYKAIFVPVEGNPRIITYDQHKPEKFLGTKETGGIPIFAPEYKDLHLAVFYCKNSSNLPINKTASKILSYTLHHYHIKPYIVRGPCVIVDDDIPLGNEQYQVLRTIIADKKTTVIPPKVLENIKRMEKQDANTRIPEPIRNMRKNSYKDATSISEYGKRIGDFPDWL